MLLLLKVATGNGTRLAFLKKKGNIARRVKRPTPVSALLHAATLVQKKLPLNSVNYLIINSLYAGKALLHRVYIYRYLKGIREIYKKILILKFIDLNYRTFIINAVALQPFGQKGTCFILNKILKFLEANQQVTLVYLYLVKFINLNLNNLLSFFPLFKEEGLALAGQCNTYANWEKIKFSNAIISAEPFLLCCVNIAGSDEVSSASPPEEFKEIVANTETKGTSETTRGLTFDFSFYKKKLCEHKPKIDQNFLEWFIGFTEGDGSFIVKKRIVKKTGKIRLSLSFDITQTLNDVQVLYKIKTVLGFGKIIIFCPPSLPSLPYGPGKGKGKDSERNVASFYVTGKENFSRLISIFNGNICSNYRINQFKNWVEAYNEIYKENEVIIERKIKPSLDSAWLSGFIDAEGSFQGSVRSSKTSKLKFTPKMAFQISQKNKDILYEIRLLFTNKNIGLNYDKSWNGWRLCFYSIKTLYSVKSYVNKYKLKTRKHISFLKWSNVLD
jgi:LAGLIDADG endonuclease